MLQIKRTQHLQRPGRPLGPRRPQRGISLLELCTCAGISALLTAAAVPAFGALQQRQRLYAVSQTLLTDLQHARSAAVLGSDPVHIHFNRTLHGSCYVLHGGAANQCHCDDGGTPVCSNLAALIKLQWVPETDHVVFQSNVSQMSFQARQGTVAKMGTIQLSNANGELIHQIVNIVGRTRACSPAGKLARYPKC
ncbi:GspH/FimT family pseudopilin [Roseateles koreensis]|uniref:Type II secretion system protein H n=1 Tax=Roseateles koreensis TaxID=2987526 RepID=A0ABT5KNJ2_9BURK|nr:GspH/FimT family pseudopilin [Roseateles koreensis]MDC8784481.1 GspH/FimT family pseudopilin [Roseateles koreensis]